MKVRFSNTVSRKLTTERTVYRLSCVRRMRSIIVLRHADDLSGSWPSSSDVFTLPNGVHVPVPQHGLSPAGVARAKLLPSVIPKWMRASNFGPIGRVITKDPSKLEYTPNPFDTIYPTIQAQRVMDVVLLPGLSDLQKLMSDFSRSFPSTGSLIICWDAEGIWGPKNATGNRPASPIPGSILDTLSMSPVSTYPLKGTTLYAFTGSGPKYTLSKIVNVQKDGTVL